MDAAAAGLGSRGGAASAVEDAGGFDDRAGRGASPRGDGVLLATGLLAGAVAGSAVTAGALGSTGGALRVADGVSVGRDALAP